MTHFSAHVQHRRLALLFVLLAFLSLCEGGVAVVVDQQLPEEHAAEHRVPPPPPPGAPVRLVDAATRSAHFRLHKGGASRRTLVREVVHQDWFLLDGDELLPIHRADATPAEVRTGGQTDTGKVGAVAATVRESVPVILAEPRRPAPAVHLQVVQAASKDVRAAPPAELPPTHIDDGGDKIALQSLRLVVTVANANADDDDEEDDGETKKVQLSPRTRAVSRGGAQFGDGRSILLSHSRGAIRMFAPARDRNTRQDAATPQNRSGAQTSDVAEKTAVKRTAHADLFPAGETAPGAATVAHIYTDEELRRRCVVANGRAADPAVLRAMLEGRLRKDCIVVAADVGNDIPTENNAKGAVAIVSLFVSTLFLVFALVF